MSENIDEYMVSQYRIHKFDENHILVTVDNGAWVVLDNKEYELFRLNRISEDKKLYDKLYEKGIIITKSNIDQIVEDYRERYWFLFEGPTLHIMVPTFRCNMKCAYCHSFSKPPDAKGWDMDNDTAKAVVDFMFKTPARGLTIEFQGGDCSLNFNAVEYAINYARELAKKQNKSVNFSIVTNLTNVDDDFIKFLKNNIPIGLCTSLDGPKEVHDKNRKYFGGKGTYDDVTSSIKKIQEEMKGYDFRFHALTTITKHSLPYWKEIIDEYRKFGFKSIWLRYLNEIGFAKQSWKEIGYTAEEYVDFWKKSFEYILKLNKEKIPMSEGWARLISSVILNKKSSNNVDFRSPCGAGIGQLLYNHKGDIYTCDEAKVDDIFKLGNVKTSSYKEVLSSPTVTSIIDISSKFPTMCDASPWFPYSSICPVNVYKSHGNIIPDTVNDLRIKIQYEMIKKIFEKIIFNKEEGKILKKWAGTC